MKMRPKCILLTVLWCALLIDCSHGHRWRKRRRQSEGGYIFTSPRSLKIGSDNELQLYREGNLEKGTLFVRLYYSETYNGNQTLALENEYKIESGKKDSFYKLFVNPFDVDYVYNGKIEIEGSYGGKEIKGEDKIQYSSRNQKNNLIIIQTDKPLYKPGQKVKFRVLKVDKDLKPSNKHDDIADVFVEDPKGTRLFQFKNIHLGKGIHQLEFDLADEPVKGSWKITVQGKNDTFSSNFDVKEYVLPKYDVSVKFPPFVLANAKEIPVEICARYTYGKNVVGTLNLNASVETYSWSNDKQPTIQETFKIDGCYNYTINVSVIEPDSVYRYRRIKVVANVIETGTEVQRNATEYLQRQYSPLNLNFGNDDGAEYFKPGLPYRGKLQVNNPDNTPAADEPIEICATISRERVIVNWFGTKKIKICENYTSDEQGVIKFTLPPQNTDSVSIVLEARSLKYARDPNSNSGGDNILNTPQARESLSPYFSPSGSFIQLESQGKPGKPLPCDQLSNIRLLFTSKENEEYKFQYQVIRQSEIVQTGEAETTFTSEDDISKELTNSDDVIDGSETQLVPPPPPKKDDDSSSSSSSEECPGTKEARYVPPIGKVDIPIYVDASLSSSFTLLVFYTRGDREVVADSRKYEVQKCFKNQVEFKFGDKVKQPATKTSVEVKASPNSLCGIKVVDKSVSLLDSSDQLTKDKIFSLLSGLDSNYYYSPNPCNENKPQPGLYSSKLVIRPPPPGYSTSTYQDSLAAFQDSGFLVISDLLLFTRPCSSGSSGYGSGGGYGPGGPGGPVKKVNLHAKVRPVSAMASTARRPAAGAAADAKSGVALSTKSAVEVRDYFPETWLFDMEMTNPNGEFVTKSKLPHTITEWVGSAVCLNPEDGLGLSDTTTIKGFQAFFISYTLPVKTIRGEEFWVVVSIFNYADGALPISVSLDQPEGFEVTGESINGPVCVEPNQSSNLRLKLKGTKLGAQNITVRAETAPSADVCGSMAVSDAVAKDAITQSLEVEAEGYPAESVTSTLFCPTDSENQMFANNQKLSLPDDVVPDSSRAIVDVTGNVLGPAIQNLNSLVSLPTGCGEQNMVKFTPNYVVLDYLKAIDQLTEKIKNQAIKNLNTGYQRELNYKHQDGSFSAFGEVDREGSMFLTAFVLKSFYEAKEYINIDNNVLVQAQEWIVSKQLPDGCFPNVGRIIDYGLQGGIEKEKDNNAITAYVLSALLISKYENTTVIENAFSCIQKDSQPSSYETFLYAYAEALDGKSEQAKERLTSIKPRANTTDGVEFYRNVNGSKSLELETAAYAVLANLQVGNTASDALPLVRYMTQNLNPNGGFYSTQDTCVGIEALGQYAKLVYRDPVDILVDFQSGLTKKVEVTQDNKLLVQRSLVSQIPAQLKFEATGSGCALIQTSLRYNTVSPPTSEKFSIAAEIFCQKSGCKQQSIRVSVNYLPEGKIAGMSVVEVKLITGLSPVKESLENLVANNQQNKILRFDVEDNKVILYLSEVDSKVNNQFSFDVEQVVEVENPQPGSAKVYDYYSPEYSSSTSYSLSETDQSGAADGAKNPDDV